MLQLLPKLLTLMVMPVVEINGTPETGLVAAVILTEEADSDAYSDETTVSIQASDELDRNWETVAQF